MGNKASKQERQGIYHYGNAKLKPPALPQSVGTIRSMNVMNSTTDTGASFIILDSNDNVWVAGLNYKGALGFKDPSVLKKWKQYTFFRDGYTHNDSTNMSISRICTSMTSAIYFGFCLMVIFIQMVIINGVLVLIDVCIFQ